MSQKDLLRELKNTIKELTDEKDDLLANEISRFRRELGQETEEKDGEAEQSEDQPEDQS